MGRIYGPEIQASKNDVAAEFTEKSAVGRLPQLKPTPTLMNLIESNATLFTGAETARRSVPDEDDYADDAYARPLGKRKPRRDKDKMLSRSRRRTVDRQRRLKDEGPGSARKRDDDDEWQETPLYY